MSFLTLGASRGSTEHSRVGSFEPVVRDQATPYFHSPVPVRQHEALSYFEHPPHLLPLAENSSSIWLFVEGDQRPRG